MRALCLRLDKKTVVLIIPLPSETGIEQQDNEAPTSGAFLFRKFREKSDAFGLKITSCEGWKLP